MIENISINNYALIDHTHIELEKGFSVITGETGAGKSILLGAIGLTLGQRADSSAIMDKTKKCIVEIEYNIAGYALKEWFDENDLDYSEQVMVRRELTAEGKSRCFINDTPVNNKLLKDFGTYMIDIHSQHQSLLLGHPEYQTDILDAFCGNRELSELYQADFRERQQLKSALKQLKDRAADAEKESDYLQFQFNQLESARLQLGEKEALEEELELLTHAENIKSALSGLSWNLRDTEQSVIQVLKGSRNAISALENAFKEAGEYRERLDSVIIELNDLADEGERRAESVEDKKTFTVGFDAEYPPYGYMDENGEYTGFDLELAEAVCKLEGWELVKKPLNWDSKDMELNSGSIDCIWNGFTMNGREDDYTFSTPYVDNSQVIVVAEKSGIDTLEDLAGKTVGVQAASAALDLLQSEEEGGQKKLADTFGALNEFADYNTAFTELQAGALDALAIDVGVANYQIKSRGEGYKILDETLNTEQYAIGFKKGNQELCDVVNADLKKLTEDGTVAKQKEKYEIADMVTLK